MPPGLQLGVDQLAIHSHLVAPAIGRDEGDLGDPRFKVLEQVDRQTDGPVGIVSDCAILDPNFMSHANLLGFNKTPRR